MNTMDLWKNIEKLSVDEFMCLLFELEPGTVQFDYGNPKNWPKNADLIYRKLTEDLQAKKLRVFFDDISGDPFYNGAYDRFYAGTDNPWWAACSGINSVGKIHKHELVKWLAKNDYPSVFFDVAPSTSVSTKSESSAESTKQIPIQDVIKERESVKTDEVDATDTAPQASTDSFTSVIPLNPSVDGQRVHSVNVPSVLWQGKPFKSVRDAMRPGEEHDGFSDAVIAYVLFNWCELRNKTQLGRLLGKPDRDESSYRRLTDRLLKKAASFTITHD